MQIKKNRTIISEMPIFKNISINQLNNLSKLSRILNLFKEDFIYKQSDISKGIYYIIQGEVKIKQFV